jgi:hypothetical protein
LPGGRILNYIRFTYPISSKGQNEGQGRNGGQNGASRTDKDDLDLFDDVDDVDDEIMDQVNTF